MNLQKLKNYPHPTSKVDILSFLGLSMSLDIVKEKLTEEIREENKGQAELQN